MGRDGLSQGPTAPTATAHGQLGRAPPLLLLSVPGCSHPPSLQPHRDSPGEMTTPPSCETSLDQLDPLGKPCSVPACDFAERATQQAAPLEWCIMCPLHTAHRSTALELKGMEPQSHSQARAPRDPAEGAQWQQGKQVWLERMQLPSAASGGSRGSTGHLRDLTSDTCPLQRIQITAWGGFACQSPPSAGCKDQSSKCHSSSAVNPCLGQVRSYTVSHLSPWKCTGTVP